MEFTAEGRPPSIRTGWTRLGFLAFGLSALLLTATLIVRILAPAMDHGLVNILTLILSFFAWLSAVLGLACLNLRAWKVVLGLPFIAAAVVFSLYKFERVDSELVPKFRSRWIESASLPTKPSADPDGFINPSKLEPAATDYPQFLGANRNAVVENVRLNPDWNLVPPKVVWRHPIGDGWSAFAIQGDVGVTMEQREQHECVSAYDISDGRPLWLHAVPGLHTNVMGGSGPRATPTIYKNRVFAQTGAGKVLCLELATGTSVWQTDLLALAKVTQAEFEADVAWGRSSSPLIADEQLVIPLGGKKGSIAGTLIALDLATGQPRWQAGADQISYSSPTLAVVQGVRQILYISEHLLSGFDLKSGAVLWSADWPGSSNGDASVSQPVPLDDTTILLSKGYGRGSKIVNVTYSAGKWATAESQPAVRNGLLKTKFTTCVVKDGYAYGLSDGILECVDTRQMKRQWKQGRYRHGHVLLVGDYLVVTSEGGELVLLEASPTKFNELAKIPVIGDVTWNTPALSGNRLLMRNSDEAACVLLPVLP